MRKTQKVKEAKKEKLKKSVFKDKEKPVLESVGYFQALSFPVISSIMP